jgi:hypothetical protein
MIAGDLFAIGVLLFTGFSLLILGIGATLSHDLQEINETLKKRGA